MAADQASRRAPRGRIAQGNGEGQASRQQSARGTVAQGYRPSNAGCSGRHQNAVEPLAKACRAWRTRRTASAPALACARDALAFSCRRLGIYLFITPFAAKYRVGSLAASPAPAAIISGVIAASPAIAVIGVTPAVSVIIRGRRGGDARTHQAKCGAGEHSAGRIFTNSLLL
jgi:hypothetical protein